MDIDTARKEIDAIDTLFAELFEKRMKLARAIGEEKLKQNLPIEDKAREQQIMNARCSLINSAELRPGFERVRGEMIKVSKSYQRSLVDRQEGYATEFASKMLQVDILPSGKVGYSGIEGSYAHEAVCQIFPDSDSEGFNGFEEVLRHLGKDIEYGVLPIENSSTGGIAEVYDLLRKYGAYIVGEHTAYIDHCLLGIKGGSVRQVKKVLSHQEGIMQCRDYVAMHKLQSETMVNTAVAAKYVSDKNDVELAAIGSAKNAELYGLEILEKGINFNKNNYTRFIVVAPRPEYQKGADKISIYLSLPHVSGSLASLLDIFADEGLNLVKIESRPIYKKNWEYYFYIDIKADITDANTLHALDLAAEHSDYMEILGGYKSAQN